MKSAIEKEAVCRICGKTGNDGIFKAREMMFDSGGEFEYFKCSGCDCLQMLGSLEDASKYYEAGYYSFSSSPVEEAGSSVKAFLRRKRDEHAVFGKGLLGGFFFRFFPDDILFSLCRAEIKRDSRILDVGCGGGRLLRQLDNIGFKNLSGIDAFIESDIDCGNFRVKKGVIYEVREKWDLIMFHDSFEHVPDPEATLCSVYGLLEKGGMCILRMPVVPCLAWEKYGICWVELDAPRHHFIHSKKSVRILADKAGLIVEDIVYDSTDFQFWGSEQYVKGIALASERSYSVDPDRAIFSKKDIKRFKKEAKRLNREKRGDRAVFYLRKK